MSPHFLGRQSITSPPLLREKGASELYLFVVLAYDSAKLG